MSKEEIKETCACEEEKVSADTEVNEKTGENEEAGCEETENKKEKKHSKLDSKKHDKQTEKLKGELEACEAKLKESEDKYLRLLAEYDNFRRRSKEEKDAVYSGAVADTVSELLPLFDNLELATKYTASGDAAKGVEMILSTTPEILAKIGVTSFGEPGETFDPNIHNAVMHVDDENLGEGEITDVFQKGYKHGDKIIRFAMVKVAN